MEHNLLVGKSVRLTARNPETDAATVAGWARDTAYMQLLEADPISPPVVKEWRERLEQMPNPRMYPFALRLLDSEAIIGFVMLLRVDHANGNAYVGIGIGDAAQRGKGYGSEAMNLILRFAFKELNLHRVSLEAVSTNASAIRSYEKCGFVHEGRTRGTDYRAKKRVDLVSMGILRRDWERLQGDRQNGNQVIGEG